MFLCSMFYALSVCVCLSPSLPHVHSLTHRQTADRILGRMPTMNFDFGLVVEAREDETLPERVLMCVHLEQLDVRNADVWGT